MILRSLQLAALGVLTATAMGCAHPPDAAPASSESHEEAVDAPIFISDIDDTIRPSGVLDDLSGILHNPPGTEFPGTLAVYSGLTQANLFYLTAAPPRAKEFISEQWLLDAQLNPAQENVIGGKQPGQETGQFKLDKLLEFHRKRKAPNTKYVLIGDNGEQDIAAYGAFTDNPNGSRDMSAEEAALEKATRKSRDCAKTSTYIHHVYENTPKLLTTRCDQVEFLTAADLAVHFFNNNWIDEVALKNAINEVAANVSQHAPDPGSQLSVIPSFMSCKRFDFAAFPPLTGNIDREAIMDGKDVGERHIYPPETIEARYNTLKANLQAICTDKERPLGK